MFSVTIGCPSAFDAALHSARMVRSAVPPGGPRADERDRSLGVGGGKAARRGSKPAHRCRNGWRARTGGGSGASFLSRFRLLFIVASCQARLLAIMPLRSIEEVDFLHCKPVKDRAMRLRSTACCAPTLKSQASSAAGGAGRIRHLGRAAGISGADAARRFQVVGRDRSECSGSACYLFDTRHGTDGRRLRGGSLRALGAFGLQPRVTRSRQWPVVPAAARGSARWSWQSPGSWRAPSRCSGAIVGNHRADRRRAIWPSCCRGCG